PQTISYGSPSPVATTRSVNPDRFSPPPRNRTATTTTTATASTATTASTTHRRLTAVPPPGCSPGGPSMSGPDRHSGSISYAERPRRPTTTDRPGASGSRPPECGIVP